MTSVCPTTPERQLHLLLRFLACAGLRRRNPRHHRPRPGGQDPTSAYAIRYGSSILLVKLRACHVELSRALHSVLGRSSEHWHKFHALVFIRHVPDRLARSSDSSYRMPTFRRRRNGATASNPWQPHVEVQPIPAWPEHGLWRWSSTLWRPGTGNGDGRRILQAPEGCRAWALATSASVRDLEVHAAHGEFCGPEWPRVLLQATECI